MDDLGLQAPLLAAQLINLALIAVWIALAVFALLRLRRSELRGVAQAIWAALIVLVPLLGALAFLIVRPRRG